MARVLIIGYGNSLRADDSLGWDVAVQLFRTNHSPDVQILPCHQLTPELAEPVGRSELVLFIDCAREGVAGEFRCDELRCETEPGSFTHDLSPTGLLDLASQLFGSSPRAFLLSISGEKFEAGASMSQKVRARVPDLTARVRDLVSECLHRETVFSR